ncbi:MAG: carboxypeptidase-like regulatory domain-containing protein, partial [Fimbriimonadales bacterium]|nr:carboxypeptidase-like regulatory domain-containing protein [Fimbriimonadales bacterium]
MRTLAKGWAGLGWLLVALSGAAAQQWLDLRFHDSVSGRALRAEVFLTEQNTQQSYSFRALPDGRLAIWLPEGEYTLHALHAGYQSVAITLRVDNSTPPHRFYMDPLTPPQATDWRFLWT